MKYVEFGAEKAKASTIILGTMRIAEIVDKGSCRAD